MKPTIFLCGLIPLLLLTACAGLSPVSTPSPTPVAATGTPNPTPTIIWFPPTNTPTFFPTGTLLPTPEQHPGLAERLFTDTFDTPNLWSRPVSSSARAVVDHNQLILSITGKGPLLLLSRRSQPVLRDFYAEATATISLCAGKDQFGMVFRAAPDASYYRYSIICDGEVQLERVTSGSLLPLLEWLPTGDAPIGAPSVVKLSVWAVGGEMRFFLNDQFQFTQRDPVFNAVIRGWGNYHRKRQASRTFNKLDSWMFQRAVRFVKRRHGNHTWSWIHPRYWGQLHPGRKDRWVFGILPDGPYVQKFTWMTRQRYVMVKGTASPDDPKLRTYWRERTDPRYRVRCLLARVSLPINGSTLDHESGQ